jgi:hypothetical protein
MVVLTWHLVQYTSKAQPVQRANYESFTVEVIQGADSWRARLSHNRAKGRSRVLKYANSPQSAMSALQELLAAV